jgi:hypothetical protein
MGFNSSRPQGEKIAGQVKHSLLIILSDENTPTRLQSNGAPTSLDLTLASAHIALASTWATHVKLNSDHLPIMVSLPSDEAPLRRPAKTYTNFRKVDWALFVRDSEAAFRQLQHPTSCGARVKTFNYIINEAAKHAIPAGFHRDYAPDISRKAAELIQERDEIRAADPTDPVININKIISDNKREIWRDKISASGSRPDMTKLWNLLRGFSGKRMFVH